MTTRLIETLTYRLSLNSVIVFLNNMTTAEMSSKTNQSAYFQKTKATFGQPAKQVIPYVFGEVNTIGTRISGSMKTLRSALDSNQATSKEEGLNGHKLSIKNEVRNRLNGEQRTQISAEARRIAMVGQHHKLLDKIYSETKSFICDEFGEQMKEEVYASFEDTKREVKEALIEELTPKITSELHEGLQQAIWRNYEKESAGHRAKMMTALKTELKPEVERRLEATLQPKIWRVRIAQLEVEVTKELREELRAKVVADLQGELRGQVVAELRAELGGQVGADLRGELRGQVEAEMRQELQSERAYAPAHEYYGQSNDPKRRWFLSADNADRLKRHVSEQAHDREPAHDRDHRVPRQESSPPYLPSAENVEQSMENLAEHGSSEAHEYNGQPDQGAVENLSLPKTGHGRKRSRSSDDYESETGNEPSPKRYRQDLGEGASHAQEQFHPLDQTGGVYHGEADSGYADEDQNGGYSAEDDESEECDSSEESGSSEEDEGGQRLQWQAGTRLGSSKENAIDLGDPDSEREVRRPVARITAPLHYTAAQGESNFVNEDDLPDYESEPEWKKPHQQGKQATREEVDDYDPDQTLVDDEEVNDNNFGFGKNADI